MKNKYSIMINDKYKMKIYYDLDIKTLSLIENILKNLNISFDIFAYIGEYRPKNKKQNKKQK